MSERGWSDRVQELEKELEEANAAIQTIVQWFADCEPSIDPLVWFEIDKKAIERALKEQ